MTLNWYGEQAKLRVKNATAKGLLRAAIHFQAAHQQALSRSYPPASKPGEYPRARTFNLRSSVRYAPTSVKAVERTLRVVIGYERRAFYGIVLELRRRRLGLLATLKRLRSQLAVLIGSK